MIGHTLKHGGLLEDILEGKGKPGLYFLSNNEEYELLKKWKEWHR